MFEADKTLLGVGDSKHLVIAVFIILNPWELPIHIISQLFYVLNEFLFGLFCLYSSEIRFNSSSHFWRISLLSLPGV